MSKVLLSSIVYLFLFNNLYASKIVDEYNINANFFCVDGKCKEKKDDTCQDSKCLNNKRLLIAKYKEKELTKVEEDKEKKEDSQIIQEKEEEPNTSLKKAIFGLKDDFLYKYDLSGVYLSGALIINQKYDISGARFYKGYDVNAGYFPQNTIPLGFNISFGFNKALPYNIFLGAEFFYMEPGIKTLSKWNVGGVVANGSIYSNQVDINSTTSIQRSLGFKIKVGLHFWRIGVYGILGYSYNMISDLSYGLNVSFSDSSQVGASGFVYGAGLEFYVTNAFFFKFEYFENIFSYKNTFNSIYVVNANGLVTGNKLKLDNSIRIGTLLIGFGFKFTI